MICNICKCKFNNKMVSVHNKSQIHKIAVQLHATSIKPIEDIKKPFWNIK